MADIRGYDPGGRPRDIAVGYNGLLVVGASPDPNSWDNVKPFLVDSLGRTLISAAAHGASEVKVTRASNTSSTTRATALTPTAGKAVRILSVNISFTGTTENGLEVYFGTGTNISSTVANAIAEARQAAIGPVFEAWLDGAGPIGDADEVVSLRGTASVAQVVDLIIVYREE